jgi:type III pantothenate kinase
MNNFVLAVDVGNTATTTGLFRLRGPLRNPVPAASWTIATAQLNVAGPFRRFLRARVGGARLRGVEGAMVSSVVPRVDGNLARDLQALTGAPAVFVNHRTPSPVRIRYRKPSEVGADRLVNARAAWQLHAGASIVIDFGTATTFDCVSRRGEYMGGVIAPGPAIAAEALFRRTAKLPMVYLEEPADILGKNTLESIRAGLYHGYRGLVKEVVARLKSRLEGRGRGGRVRVFTTGGQAAWILRGVPGVDRHVPHLTLSGLYHLWTDRTAP